MRVERVEAGDRRLEDYGAVREPLLLARRGVFIAESREVVRVLLASRFRVRSLLVTPTALEALDGALGRLEPETPVYVAERAVLERVVGYDVHRGCMGAGERGEELPLADLMPPAGARGLLVLLDRVSNPDNVGGIIRNAVAFGACGLVLGPGCADPLYRKAIRVSLGGSLRLPFVRVSSWPAALAELREAGFAVAALTPAREAVELAELGAPPPRLALLLGNEGEGLGEPLRAAADVRLRIGMRAPVDSLNVSAAAAVALYWASRPLG